MARELGVPLHEVIRGGGRLRRTAASIAATVRLLRRERPSVVFGSNPSLVLTAFLLLSRRIFGFRFVSDAHYGGVVAVNGGRLTQRVLDFVNARADVVIVTTEGHARRVRGLGGAPFVFPDPLPHLPESVRRPPVLDGVTKSVLFICSFDKDEPFDDVFEASKDLARRGFTVLVSGRYARVGIKPGDVPQVRLLGYVDRETYDGLLRHCDVVLDLTTWEDCLVCGAYEAMVARKPCVLSRTASLTEFFTSGTVFTSHSPEAIAASVLAAFEGRVALSEAIPSWLARHERTSRDSAVELRRRVQLPVAA